MKNALPYPPPWQDATTLCAHLCISDGTLDTWVREARLPAARLIGGKRMWEWAEVERRLRAETGIVPGDEADLVRRVNNVTRTATGG